MDDAWPETFPERMRWARTRAGHRTPTDAARALELRPGTYRTYETHADEGGRMPPLPEIQRIARRFQVSWTWLAVGEGRPDQGVLSDDRIAQISEKVARLPPEERDTALDAALSVVETFARRAK